MVEAEEALVEKCSNIFGGFAGHQRENLEKAIGEYTRAVKALWDLEEKKRREGEAASASAPPPLLVDMRAVYGSKAREDSGLSMTVTQQVLRKMLKEDPNGFFKQMAGMEKAHQQAQTRKEERAREVKEAVEGALAKVQEEKRDVGTEKALALATKLIEKLGRESKDG